ncbi:MAG TPA: hypothetical protein VMS00_15750 [Acidimicrobiales bacterium]|nr:hypothetical protein [Acidimicrobiales bacterium]
MAFRRHYYAATLLVAAACLLSSCSTPAGGTDKNGLPLGPISANQISHSALAHLIYPGSVPFSHIHQGTTDASMSDGPAASGAFYTSSATGAEIYAWYRSKLASLGWTYLTDNGCNTPDVTCPQYGHDGHGNREVFYLGIVDPYRLSVSTGTHAPGGACTVYDASYLIYPPGGIRAPRPQVYWSGSNACWWTPKGYSVPAGTPFVTNP